MPRRTEPDVLAARVGRRIRQLRMEAGLTLEKLAFESGGSKGHFSDVENGLAPPTVLTLKAISDCLELTVADVVCFPKQDARQRLFDLTRTLSDAAVRRLVTAALAEVDASTGVAKKAAHKASDRRRTKDG